MQQESVIFKTISEVHRVNGELIQACSRLLMVICLAGLSFSIVFMVLFQVASNPMSLFQAQGLIMNKAELPLLTQQAHMDPNWDGALSGMTLGANLFQGVPMAGVPLGACLGAVVGYQLDRAI